jgi:glycosyltransferase involved in cell wall biosynthesis
MKYAMLHTGWKKRLKKFIFLHLEGYRYLNGAEALHCTSEQEILDLKAYPVYSPTFLIPNSFDVSTYQKLPDRGKLREQYHIPAEALVMVMIGRLDAVKNAHIAVAALIASQNLSKDVHLIIVGPDEQNLQSTLENQAHLAGCFDKLHFVGLLQKDALIQAMVDADLLVMPSESENFGMSAAESMAAGLPILTTDVVPVGRMAKKVHAGETVPCNKELFCEAVVRLLGNPAALKEMGKNGKDAAEQLFDREVVSEQMLFQIKRLIEESKRKYV